MHYNIIICIINTTFVFYLHDSVLINELTKYNHRIGIFTGDFAAYIAL